MNTTIGLFWGTAILFDTFPAIARCTPKAQLADGPSRRDFLEIARLGFVEVPCNLEPLIKLAFNLAIASVPVTLEGAAKKDRVAKSVRRRTFPQGFNDT